MAYEIKKRGGKFVVCNAGGKVLKSYAKRDDAVLYMRSLNPDAIVSALEHEAAPVSAKVAVAERKFVDNREVPPLRVDDEERTPEARRIIEQLRSITAATFDESKHRRAPKGVKSGGRFVAKASADGFVVEDEDGKVVAETATVEEAVAVAGEKNLDSTGYGATDDPKEYSDLAAKGEALGVPVALDDPLSPETVPELKAAVDAAETGEAVDYERLALDAEDRVDTALTQDEREFWQRKADEHWNNVPSTVNESGIPTPPPVAPSSVAIGELGGSEFHQIGDQVYRVPAGAEISSVTGLPMGARWESSAAHWETYKGMEGTVPFMATNPTIPIPKAAESMHPITPRQRSSVNESAVPRSPEQMSRDFAQATGKDIAKSPLYQEEYESAVARAKAAKDAKAKAGRLTASGDLELAGLTASAAGMAPDVPPAEWFDDPELDGPTPLTVTPEGRVFGHVASWGTCHTGIQGRCVQPPTSRTKYAYFNLAGVRTTNGVVPAGKITMDTGHAPLAASSKVAASHYDHTGVVAADVRAGEDSHGIWISGSVRPDLDANQARALERAAVSGDWRRIDGSHEMVGLLAVNVPGFPIPRAEAAVTASGFGGEVMTALVAAGIVCGCDEDPGVELDEIVVESVGGRELAMHGRPARR